MPCLRSAKIKEVWDSQADTVPAELLNATAPYTCSPSSLLPALPAVPAGELQFHSNLMGKFYFWTVEKETAEVPLLLCKLQRSGLESLCQLFSLFLWRGCGSEMQNLECYYTTLSKTFQCWVSQVPIYGLDENTAFRVSLWEQP